jgi:hypothetical protein
MARARAAAPGVVTWGWYSVTEGATPTAGGSAPGLVRRGKETAFWAAWWTVDPRLDRTADPDDHGFFVGPKAAFVAGCEAESRIRREKSARAYVISIPESFARAAYREGAPRKRSEASDFEAISGAWCDERGIPRTAVPEVVKRAWRRWLKDHHPDVARIAGHVDMELEKKRYEAALHAAREREAGQLRDRQRGDVAAGTRPVDAAGNDRATIAKARKIAQGVRARLEVIARFVGANETMAGLCHFGVLGLVSALREGGLRAVPASSGEHWWAHVLLEASDEPLLLDVTASQFGLAPVYVRLPGQPRRGQYSAAQAKGAQAKGAQAKGGAKDCVDRVIAGAPERWWVIAPTDLPGALRAAGTRLTKLGKRTMKQSANASG